MKLKLLNALTAAILFLMPNVNYGQAPTLGNASKFVLFTTNGAMTCSGTKYLTHLTGDVGSNLPGSVTGFGNVDGVMHDADVASGLCAPDVVSLYTQLGTAIPTGPLASPFGSGDTLVAGVYQAVGAATLTSNLILNGQGNPNARFIFQIGGVFTTNSLSKIILVNGALACNVFWQINGAVNVGSGTTLRGTIVANGQIDMRSTLDTLEGRALALNAAILVSQLVAYTPIGCGSPLLTGPAAPAILDSTAVYGVFSSIGAVTSTPVTYVLGSVGANSTTPTGFNPLNVTGSIHAMDPSTAAAAGDLTNIYDTLVAMPADIDLLDPPDFGHGLVLTPHAYQVTGITQLTGDIILNAEGDANAVFVIKINGSLTTGSLSRVLLINGTQAKNVYWKIDGAVDIFSNSFFNGTLVVAGAISLETGDTLIGRAWTINGAIAINGSYVQDIPNSCTAPAITGTFHICGTDTTTLTDSITGGVWSSSNSAIAAIGSSSGFVTGVTPGMDTITYTTLAGCTNTAVFTVNPAPSVIAGPGSVCTGTTITLTDTAAGGTWSSSNSLQAAVGTASGIVTGITPGTPTITYTLPAGCAATKTITVNSSTGAGIITGASNVCVGNSTPFADVVPGGIWSSSDNAIATVGTSGSVAGITAGVDTISYTVSGGCAGGAPATKTITVNPIPDPGIISGPSAVCAGNTITLTDGMTGGWSSSNTNAFVNPSGIVTGITAGIDTIRYTVVSSGCNAAATKAITVNPAPNAGLISGPSSVCVGATITLTDPADGGAGAWSASNGNATVSGGLVTGVAAGTDIISYTVSSFGCTSTATKNVAVNPLPDAGTIAGPSSVCAGNTIPLTDGAAGGIWSSSNTTVANVGPTGVVAGMTAGIDTIVYTVGGICGTDAATYSITVNPLPDAGSISGSSTVCVGATDLLTDGIAGGTWSRSNSNATVSATGLVTGVTAGTDIIDYTVSSISCGTVSASKLIVINPLANPGTISGSSRVCVGSAITLVDAAAGGTWSSSNANASVGTTGVVTGATAGLDTISYAVTNGCGTETATKAITVNPLSDAGSIAGTSNVCVGATITLSDAAAGGTWSSSNATATVGTAGVVTGITAGSDTIFYSVTNICNTATASKTVTVNPLPDAGSIVGASAVCVNATITLTEATTGGIWSSSNSRASVAAGIVTGVTAGTDTIRYAVANMCGTATATKALIVNVLPLVPVITTQAPSIACTGTMYQNFGTSTPAPASTTYRWTAANATVWAEGTGNQYALVNFTETGTGYVTLNAIISGTGCTSQSTITVNVGTSDAQTAQVSYFNNHFVCTPANESSYQWGYDDAHTLDSTIFPGEINQDYINANPDFANKKYWVLTTLGSCLQKTYYNVPTAVQNINNAQASVAVYPNPANSIINVTVSSSVQGQLQLDVLDMMGQRINSVQAIDNKAAIDITSLAAGSYLITCYSNGTKIASARFTKY